MTAWNNTNESESGRAKLGYRPTPFCHNPHRSRCLISPLRSLSLSLPSFLPSSLTHPTTASGTTASNGSPHQPQLFKYSLFQPWNSFPSGSRDTQRIAAKSLSAKKGGECDFRGRNHKLQSSSFNFQLSFS
ncbi:hypothetical protein Mapa_015351 [Marchantia paleacea]|nr:hypothetical protein Mapa_015351 [Marchantia paleacea]